MKAERRHELQANELAKQLETLPEKLKRHATTILLMLTGVVVVVYVLRYRANQHELRRAEIANAMAIVMQGPHQLRQLDEMRGPADQLARARQQITGDTNGAIETILRDAEGDHATAMRAEALVAKGDLNWSLANLAPLPEAATQPALKLPRSSEDYLRLAADAYSDVIRGYASHLTAWATAQFGLAAIAENRRDWDKAREAYNAVLARADAPEVFKTQANLRLNTVLPLIQQPVLLGNYGTPVPTTAPGATSTPAAADPFTLTPSAPPAAVAPATQP